MGPEGSSPYSQLPATCPYPEPYRCSPRPHPTFRRYILILFSHPRLRLPRKTHTHNLHHYHRRRQQQELGLVAYCGNVYMQADPSTLILTKTRFFQTLPSPPADFRIVCTQFEGSQVSTPCPGTSSIKAKLSTESNNTDTGRQLLGGIGGGGGTPGTFLFTRSDQESNLALRGVEV